MSVFYQLLKNTTDPEQVVEMDELFSTIASDGKLDMEIWGLKPNEDFPIECNPKEFNYIGYIGLSKIEDRDDIRFIEFIHENKGCSGIIEPFIDMVSKKLSTNKKDTILIPRVVRSNKSDFWTKYLSKYFTDIKSGEKFIMKNKLSHKDLHWNELTKTLPSKPDETVNEDSQNTMVK